MIKIINIIISIIIFMSFVAFGQKSLHIVENKKTEYAVFCSKAESEVVKGAAKELAAYLNKMSDAEFLVVDSVKGGKPLLVIGSKNNFINSVYDRMKFSKIKYDGFHILSDNKNIYIAGRIDRGTLYGVYYFLDKYLGVRWLSADLEKVPYFSKISFNEIDDLQNPDFAYREIFDREIDDAYLRQHNRLNGCRFHRNNIKYPKYINTWSKFIPAGPPPKFGGHNFYTVVEDKRYHSGGQLLAMNNECRKIAADYFMDVIDRYGTDYWYGFTQMDNGWQADSLSLEFSKEHGEALSAPIIDMVLSTADTVRKKYPLAKFATFAYQFSLLPPQNMKLPAYLLVEAAPIQADFGKPFSAESNRNINNSLLGWNRIVDNLSIWSYNANFQNYLQPLPNMYAMFENIKYLAGFKNIKGYFGQGAYNTKGAEFADLRAWVASRLLWNSGDDYMALIDEFCDGYYGQGAIYIKRYIKLLHKSLDNTDERISSKQRITSKYLNFDFILQADNLLAKADSAAADIYSKHVHQVRLGIDMTILLREHMYKAVAESRGMKWRHDSKRFVRFKKYAQEAGISDYSEDQSLENLFDVIAIKRVNPSVPDKLVKDKEWIDFQDMDFNICCGAAIVNDNLASDHGAVKYAGGDWAIQMSLDKLPPGGKWDLYAMIRVEKKHKSNPNEVVFSMGIYPGGDKIYRVKDVNDGNYHAYPFPDKRVSYQTGKQVWFVSGEGAKNIYIDRIIALHKN